MQDVVQGPDAAETVAESKPELEQSESVEPSADPDESLAPEDDANVALLDPPLPPFEESMAEDAPEASPRVSAESLRAVIEAVIYITDEPLSVQQIAAALDEPLDRIAGILNELVAEYEKPDRGLSVRELAGGYKMSTKAEHHEQIRRFVKKLQPPLKLSLAALETLAVIAYKQPITAPEIMEIRGVQGAGVLKTLLDRKLIAAAGRKNVLGKPILYKTTREFLVQFGLSSLAELPTLKEFEELGRMALTDSEVPAGPDPVMAAASDQPPAQETPPDNA